LIHDFLQAGFKTVICAANATLFSEHQLGETIDEKFIDQLPTGIDPCGENGEFHTLIYDGPIFKRPLIFKTGEVVKKSYSFKKINDGGRTETIDSSFWFQDLLPAGDG
jgi:diphthamide synthase (EF-2-diphthine--ammonia ligase)